MATTKTNSSLAQFFEYWAPASTSDFPTAPSKLARFDVAHVSPALPTSAGDEKVYPLVGTDLHGRLFMVRFISLSAIAPKAQSSDVLGAMRLTSASFHIHPSTFET